MCLSVQTYLAEENFEANAQPLYLTSELRSVSKLFGLFQVLFVLFVFLNTQAQYFVFELKLFVLTYREVCKLRVHLC